MGLLLHIPWLQQHLFTAIYYNGSPSTVTPKLHVNYLNKGRASQKPFATERNYSTGNFIPSDNLAEDGEDGARGLVGYLYWQLSCSKSDAWFMWIPKQPPYRYCCVVRFPEQKGRMHSMQLYRSTTCFSVMALRHHQLCLSLPTLGAPPTLLMSQDPI